MFAALQSATLEYMVERCIAISDLKTGLNSISIEHTKVLMNFFDKMFTEVGNEALTIYKLWERLGIYWNFINCTLLEHIINEFGDKVLQLSLEDYLEKLMEFQCRIHLSDFIKCSTKLSTSLLGEEFTELTVQLNRCQDNFKLEDLDEITETIANKFFIPKFFLLLKDVKVNGMIITWAAPTMIAALLSEIIRKTDMQPFCKRHKITSLTVASEKYKYSTNSIVTEVSKWCQEIDSPIPTTLTQLYTAYTCKLIMQYCKIKGIECPTIRSLEEIPAHMQTHLLELCKVAWDGIVEQLVTFDSSAVIGDTMGLIESVEGENGRHTYHFSHRTLQEFLSAYHIIQLALESQEQIIQDHIEKGDLKTVVRFYFGLTKHHQFTSRMITRHKSDLISAHHWSLESGETPETSAGVQQPAETESAVASFQLVRSSAILELLQQLKAPSSIKIPGQVFTIRNT